MLPACAAGALRHQGRQGVQPHDRVELCCDDGAILRLTIDVEGRLSGQQSG